MTPRDNFLRDCHRHSGALTERLGEAQIGLPANCRGFWLQLLLIARLGFGNARLLVGREARKYGSRIERWAIMGNGPARLIVLDQRQHDFGRPLETQALAEAHRGINKRAFEQLAGGADHMPAVAHEPTGIVQSPHGAIDVGAVLDEEVGVLASGTLYRTIIEVAQPRAGTSAPYMGAGCKARNEQI